MHVQIPETGKIYAFNEGNYEAWEPKLKEYIDNLKVADNWDGKPYSARCCQSPPPLLANAKMRCCNPQALLLRLVACTSLAHAPA